MQRREFLAASAALTTQAWRATAAAMPRGRAEHCIFIWLGGGMGQIDTFDPKPMGDNRAQPSKPGALYPAIETAVPGVQVCEHLHRTARWLERITIVRTVHHQVVNEHAFATNLVHTGRMISGTVTYPSIGSIVAHQKGPVSPEMPAYVLIGYPNVSRGPGFLGAAYGYVYLTETGQGPSGFMPPDDVSPERQEARQRLLSRFGPTVPAPSTRGEYLQAQRQAYRLSRPEFLRHFDLAGESPSLRAMYGGEFGQRCLLARRLIQAGVRFVEVSHNLNFINGTGWDVHNEGIHQQHVLIRELDGALSALLSDLEAQGWLDKTLVVVATEFGRPPEFDGRGGRGHQGSAFSMVLAGGGLNHCGAYGTTDELSKQIVSDPVSVPDFHATIHAALGIDPSAELYDGARPVPITDQGQPIRRLFS
ncbi:MAG: hypothetical protein KatS3mg114_1297 [Planctomycetaceae bacterium]|nr:MAG: hypothetical protein KatS3mg114_1297 [Planctomycetaceae bacterium]